jgi:hypothetical protein
MVLDLLSLLLLRAPALVSLVELQLQVSALVVLPPAASVLVPARPVVAALVV